MENNIVWLQQWYRSQFNGKGDQHFGISITTLDNPGWHLIINLKGTKYEGKTFRTIEKNLDTEIDWYFCSLEDDKFDAACGPKNLSDVLEIFKNWIINQIPEY